MDLPVSQKNMGTLHLPITLLNIIDFQNSITSRLSNDCLMKWSLKIPPHLERVATLLVKTMCSKIALISMLTPVEACPSWAFEQDNQFPRRAKRFSYIRCDTTVLVSIDFFSGCDLYCILCLPKQFVHHSLPPLEKCNNLRDRGHPYKISDLSPPNSPDLNPINCKIWGIIQFTVQKCRTWRMWCSFWLMRGMEWKTPYYSRRHWPSAQASPYCIHPQAGIMNIKLQKLV